VIGLTLFEPSVSEKDCLLLRNSVYKLFAGLGLIEKFLSIRQFEGKYKRAAYEQRQGNCQISGKHFDFEKVYADHIKPWHAGGKVVPENLWYALQEL